MGVEFRPLTAEEVEVRVNQCTEKGCSLLLYKTARTDMQLLDETFGADKWQCRYDSIDEKLFCEIGVKFDDEWVWKSDTGTESNMEAQKGEASDAFKRAGFKWGIGRELYTAPRIWVGSDMCDIREGKNGRKQCYDDFRVTEMEVEDGRIVALQVCNMSKRGVVVYGNGKGKQEPTLEEAKRALWEACKKNAEANGTDPKDVLADLEKNKDWKKRQEDVAWLMDKARVLEGTA